MNDKWDAHRDYCSKWEGKQGEIEKLDAGEWCSEWCSDCIEKINEIIDYINRNVK
jgi:hypothetical protein